MAWVKRNLRGTMVFVRARAGGALDVGPDGRVDVRYKDEEGAKVYRAAERNLGPPVEEPDAPPASSTSASGLPSGTRKAAASPPGDVQEPIIIYTDGACSRNPGPMGLGVVIKRGKERQEIGEYLGTGTNNIAELTAIERAIDALSAADRGRRILIHADSAYALGVVSGEMKPKKNLELVGRIRSKARAFPHIEWVKVRGHAGVVENERCDALATGAISGRS